MHVFTCTHALLHIFTCTHLFTHVHMATPQTPTTATGNLLVHQKQQLAAVVLTTGRAVNPPRHQLHAALHAWRCTGLDAAKALALPAVGLTDLVAAGIQHAAQVWGACGQLLLHTLLLILLLFLLALPDRTIVLCCLVLRCALS